MNTAKLEEYNSAPIVFLWVQTQGDKKKKMKISRIDRWENIFFIFPSFIGNQVFIFAF